MGKQEQVGSSRSFDISNLTTDPFALSTIIVAFMAWIVAFAGSLSSDIVEAFPKFTWWGLVFQLLLLIGLFVIYGFDLIEQYRVFLTTGFGIALVYTTNSATNLVYANGSRKAAAAAGVILLSMINIIYLFYFGGDSSSPVNQWIDSFSLKGARTPNPFYRQSYSTNRYSSANNQSDVYRRSQSNSRYMSSTRLQGLENFSERDTDSPVFINQHNEGTHISAETELSGTNDLGIDSNLVIDDFPYTARALYAYESSPEDENEISFEKGEILKVNDIHSRWWQAKRSNGDIGICPSNYVELIE